MLIAWPNFTVASDWYYRNMLDSTYEKIKTVLKEQIEMNNTEYMVISLYGWSSYHHGYLGVNVHYIHEEESHQLRAL